MLKLILLDNKFYANENLNRELVLIMMHVLEIYK